MTSRNGKLRYRAQSSHHSANSSRVRLNKSNGEDLLKTNTLKKHQKNIKKIVKIQSLWRSYKIRKTLLQKGLKLPKKRYFKNKNEELLAAKLEVKSQNALINDLKSQVATLQLQVNELTKFKDQHEEALSYLFQQVNAIRKMSK